MNHKVLLVALFVLLALDLSVMVVDAQGPRTGGRRSPAALAGTAFTYQGQLKNGGALVNGSCDLAFRLYDSAGGSNQVGSAITQTLPITNGLFTTPLDFGAGGFNGDARWLDLQVRCPMGVGGFTALSPRQQLMAAPYALYGLNNWGLAGNSAINPSANFLGTTDNVTLTLRVSSTTALRLAPNTAYADSPIVIGGYGGNLATGFADGSVIYGGSPLSGANIISGTDATYSAIGGGINNAITGASVYNSVIAGGTNNRIMGPNAIRATIGGGYGNTASNSYATVGGGAVNTASGPYATVGGGYSNTVSNQFATIGGGAYNTVSNTSATVGGGYNNTASGYAATVGGGINITASNQFATVGGGSTNIASGAQATVGGGYSNTVSNTNATIGGGYGNTAGGNAATIGGGQVNNASNTNATIGGGYGNTASGNAATIGGGSSNTANGNGAFVGGGGWDGVGTLGNQASANASTIGGGLGNISSGYAAVVGGGGGFFPIGTTTSIISNTASGNWSVVGGGSSNQATGDGATIPGGNGNRATGVNSFAAGTVARATYDGAFVWADSTSYSGFSSTSANQFLIRASGGISLYTNSLLTTGCNLAPGSGTWNCTSDRNAKTNFAATDGRDILVRLSAIPIQTWNFKTQDPSIRHIGPMAQDFYAAFGMGDSDTTIGTVDADGVAFAAIQGLYQIVQEKDAQIASQQKQINSLDARVAALEQGSTLASLSVNHVVSEANPSANARTQSNDLNAAIALVVGAAGVIVIERARKGGTK